MKRAFSAALVITATLAVAACGGGSSGGSAAAGGQLRVVNAIPDSDSINATVGNNGAGSVTDIIFQENGGLATVAPGSYSVQITATSANTSGAANFTIGHVPVDLGMQTTFYAIGILANGSQSGVFVEENVASTVPSGEVELQFVNVTATTAITGTIYLVAPGDPLSKAVYSTTLNSAVSGSTPFYAPPTQLTSGAYEVIIKASGQTIYDSGSSTGIYFPGGGSFQIAILDSGAVQISSNISPVMLNMLNNSAGTQTIYLNGTNGTAGDG